MLVAIKCATSIFQFTLTNKRNWTKKADLTLNSIRQKGHVASRNRSFWFKQIGQNILQCKTSSLIMSYSTEPCINVSVTTNDVDQCQHPREETNQWDPRHRGVCARKKKKDGVEGGDNNFQTTEFNLNIFESSQIDFECQHVSLKKYPLFGKVNFLNLSANTWFKQGISPNVDLFSRRTIWKVC